MAIAIRAGLVLLVVGQAFGRAIIANANTPPADPSTFGAAGALKMPHAVALHAVQVLPALAWLVAFTGWEERRRTRVVLTGTAGYVGLVGLNALQTFSGLAPFNLNIAGTVILCASTLLLAGAFAAVGWGLVGSARRGTKPSVAATSRPEPTW